ncbi:hypothetical protein K435DRAFT_806430 [Dendrothele bispora CBS 962.96]|uniref:Uncharacterized protein n=1 Tax=Dendrothele bispora (strain CBS 962.96) TaxID=1314807 RepID=A0A4S8L989_DENBC|nr:hypothetical protein K435DRAFT_806430 [Dendrothele bispora CBS 962.96]
MSPLLKKTDEYFQSKTFWTVTDFLRYQLSGAPIAAVISSYGYDEFGDEIDDDEDALFFGSDYTGLYYHVWGVYLHFWMQSHWSGRLQLGGAMGVAPVSPLCLHMSPSTLYSHTTPWKGTRGFFITEGADAQRLLLVTAHHVVFTSDRNTEIEDKTFMVKYQEGRNRVVELEERPAGEQETPESSARIGRGKGGGRRAQHFLPGCFNSMGHPREPYLGESYTEALAVIAVNVSKVDSSNFSGNAIDIGNLISPDKLTKTKNRFSSTNSLLHISTSDEKGCNNINSMFTVQTSVPLLFSGPDPITATAFTSSPSCDLPPPNPDPAIRDVDNQAQQSMATRLL